MLLYIEVQSSTLHATESSAVQFLHFKYCFQFWFVQTNNLSWGLFCWKNHTFKDYKNIDDSDINIQWAYFKRNVLFSQIIPVPLFTY